MATYNEKGQQVPDPRPVEVAVPYRPLSLQDEIRRFIRAEMSQKAREADLESFEEADDFDVEDEDEVPLSGYEVKEMVPELGDVDADPPPNPKARAPAKSAEGNVGGSGGETPPPPDDVQVEAKPLPKS